MERYTVISADGHAGGAIADYRPYLPSALHDRFDEWRATFVNPYEDLEGDEGGGNWESAPRLAALGPDGVLAEVVSPSPTPPLFPGWSLAPLPPGASDGDLDLRWEG